MSCTNLACATLQSWEANSWSKAVAMLGLYVASYLTLEDVGASMWRGHSLDEDVYTPVQKSYSMFCCLWQPDATTS